MPNSRQHNLKIVLKRVLRAPLSVSLITLGALFALIHGGALGTIALIAAASGVIVYAVLKMQDEDFIRTALGEERERQRKYDLTDRTFRIEELDVESRVRMKTIIKLQDEIAGDVAASPVDAAATGLSDTVEKTEELTDRALSISQQRRELQRYLMHNDEEAITARIHSLETKLSTETDPVRQAELKTSISAKQQELTDFQAIRQASARILDQLESIECSFSSLRARLVRVRSTDIAEWVAANSELQTELGTLNSAVDTLSQSVDEALTIGQTGTGQ